MPNEVDVGKMKKVEMVNCNYILSKDMHVFIIFRISLKSLKYKSCRKPLNSFMFAFKCGSHLLVWKSYAYQITAILSFFCRSLVFAVKSKWFGNVPIQFCVLINTTWHLRRKELSFCTLTSHFTRSNSNDLLYIITCAMVTVYEKDI